MKDLFKANSEYLITLKIKTVLCKNTMVYILGYIFFQKEYLESRGIEIIK